MDTRMSCVSVTSDCNLKILTSVYLTYTTIAQLREWNAKTLSDFTFVFVALDTEELEQQTHVLVCRLCSSIEGLK